MSRVNGRMTRLASGFLFGQKMMLQMTSKWPIESSAYEHTVVFRQIKCVACVCIMHTRAASGYTSRAMYWLKITQLSIPMTAASFCRRQTENAGIIISSTTRLSTHVLPASPLTVPPPITISKAITSMQPEPSTTAATWCTAEAKESI